MCSNVACSNCGCLWTSENTSEACPKCGKINVSIGVNLAVPEMQHINMKTKVKAPGKKRPISESFQGDDYSYSTRRWVKKTRILDREKDYYHEKVIDIDNDVVIHNCEEPLSKHFGHGSAKK